MIHAFPVLLFLLLLGRKTRPSHTLYLPHRLDLDTSGLVIVGERGSGLSFALADGLAIIVHFLIFSYTVSVRIMFQSAAQAVSSSISCLGWNKTDATNSTNQKQMYKKCDAFIGRRSLGRTQAFYRASTSPQTVWKGQAKRWELILFVRGKLKGTNEH